MCIRDSSYSLQCCVDFGTLTSTGLCVPQYRSSIGDSVCISFALLLFAGAFNRGSRVEGKSWTCRGRGCLLPEIGRELRLAFELPSRTFCGALMNAEYCALLLNYRRYNRYYRRVV
eukprot:TRINITY_DN14023_c0_g2_i2.p3 TRINITY_DN14023_c0_g2~~TRINITY_DN14023_c0_g2_i2.p3  ORF type:complete len:116 (+),score=5.00 TRINITY_DN14023_c0_g2_i2:71-418(+)